MIGANTRWRVALVQYALTGGNGAVRDLTTYPVGVETLTVSCEASVSGSRSRAHPEPAPLRLVDPRPEAGHELGI